MRGNAGFVRWIWIGIAAAVIAGAPWDATAQDQGDPAQADPQEAAPAPSRRPPARIEEITVTARKREEGLQTVPASVTAFSGPAIREINPTDVIDFSNFVPNLKITQNIGTAGTTLYMRGLGTTDFILTEDPSVGLYVDGVYVAKSIGSLIDLLDLERVEVLRGPQGTLYGKNTIGGTINLITAKPTGGTGTRFQLEYGNFARRRARATVEFPILDEQLAARFSILTMERNGFGRDPVNDVPFDDEHGQVVLGTLRWTPTEDLTIDYAVDWQRHRMNTVQNQLTVVQDPTTPGSLVPAITAAIGDLRPFIETDRDDTTPNDGPNREDIDVLGHALTGTWDLGDTAIGDLELKSISAYRRTNNTNEIDTDGSTLLIAHGDQHFRHRQFSQEVQLSGSSLEARLNWVLGLFYLDERGTYDNKFQFTPGLIPVFAPFLGPFADFSQFNLVEVENDSFAAFGEGTIDLTEKLSFTAGIRYTLEHKEIDRIQRTLFTNAITLPKTQDEQTFVNWSPKASLAYRWTESFMTFATIARGFKSGGFNGRDSVAAPYDDANVWSYEMGIKSRWWEDRVQLNATGFYMDYSDQQVFIQDITSGQIARIENAATSEIWGAELELLARPVEGLDLMVGFGYLDPEFEEFDDIDPATMLPIDVSSDAVFPFSPKYTFNASARYTFPPLRVGILSLRLDYYAQSSVVFNIRKADNVGISQGKYSLLGARLTLDDVRMGDMPGAFSVSLWAKNALDRAYRDHGLPFGPFKNSQYGDPRTFGIEVAWRWGSLD